VYAWRKNSFFVCVISLELSLGCTRTSFYYSVSLIVFYFSFNFSYIASYCLKYDHQKLLLFVKICQEDFMQRLVGNKCIVMVNCFTTLGGYILSVSFHHLCLVNAGAFLWSCVNDE